MVRLMLDADICVYAMNERPREVGRRLSVIPSANIGISAIVAAELWAGVEKSRNRARNAAALLDFLQTFAVLDWPAAAASVYGEIKTMLERTGRMIGAMDMLIAAHALCENAVLVTNNQAEFRRVKGLRLENWAKA